MSEVDRMRRAAVQLASQTGYEWDGLQWVYRAVVKTAEPQTNPYAAACAAAASLFLHLRKGDRKMASHYEDKLKQQLIDMGFQI